jgi:hypothetical protein
MEQKKRYTEEKSASKRMEQKKYHTEEKSVTKR